MKKAVALILFTIIVVAFVATIVFYKANNSQQAPATSGQNRTASANSTVNNTASGNVMTGSNITNINTTTGAKNG